MARTTPGRTRERVFRFVRGRLRVGEPPTVREVQEAMGFGAVESARKQLDALVAEGRLTKLPGKARGYRLARARGGAVAQVPILGEIEAGHLEEAIEQPDGWVVCEVRFDPDELFALRVRGESMVGAGILPGDVVIVRRQQTVRPGDIVAALIGDEATIKTYRLRRRHPVLEPANPSFEPIVPHDADFRILGKVIEVRRQIA